MLLVMGGLLIATHLNGQIVLQALDAPDTFTPSEKCLERVYDKHYGDGDHNFIYCAVMGPNGKKWLNLNLGAEYAREGSPHFNPEVMPTEYEDWKAFGSLFQEGRKADGHELVTYYHRQVKPDIVSDLGPDFGFTSTQDYWYVYRKKPVTDIKQDVFNSNHSFVFTNHALTGEDWATTNEHDYNLWTGEMFNNPCPDGYRVMNMSDLKLVLVNDINKIVTDTDQGLFTTSVFYNTDYHLSIVTPPNTAKTIDYFSNNLDIMTQLRLQKTDAAYKDENVIEGTSSLWLAPDRIVEGPLEIHGWNKEWEPYGWTSITTRVVENRIISFLDRGNFGERLSEYAYPTIAYSLIEKNEKNSRAIRCVQK